MPAFAKNPKVIAAVAVVLWVAYVIWANANVNQVKVHLFPFAILSVDLAGIMAVSAVFGAAVAIAVQWFWKRSSWKRASAPSAPATSQIRTLEP